MPTYLTPGIYVEEIPTGSRPIEAVGTSTAAFIGVAPNPDAHLHEALGINNWSQFIKEYSGEGATSTPLSQAVYGFFQNGGGRCYIVNAGPKKELVGDGRQRKGIETLEEVDEVAIVAAPGFSDAASYDAILSHCEKLQDRVAILDAPEAVPNIDLLKTVATSGTAKPKKGAGADTGATADTGTPAAGLRARTSDGGYGAYYFPWITIRDPFSNSLVNVPPSGHIAGIYARTDATRGVHKAPANETVRGALDLTYKITRDEQGELNRLGVNCIRQFVTQGIRVWGARTVADSASEWRYLNVRRLFNQIEESIANGTRWVVFEPMTVIGIAPVKPAEFVIFRIGQGAGGAVIETEGGA